MSREIFYQVVHAGKLLQSGVVKTPFVLGRQREGEPEPVLVYELPEASLSENFDLPRKLIIVPLRNRYIPRAVGLVAVDENGMIRIRNVHRSSLIVMGDGKLISPGDEIAVGSSGTICLPEDVEIRFSLYAFSEAVFSEYPQMLGNDTLCFESCAVTAEHSIALQDMDGSECRAFGNYPPELAQISSLPGIRTTPRGEYADSDKTKRDEVDCTIFSPPEVRLGEALMIQVFAHLPTQSEQVRSAAREYDDESLCRGATSLGNKVVRGAVIGFELSIPGLLEETSIETLVWRGKAESVQFAVRVSENEKPKSFIGQVLVSIDSVPVGVIKFKVRLVQTPCSEQRTISVGGARRFEKAFISYAAEDRNQVLRRVQMLATVGIDYFQDFIHLNPGDRWEPEIFAQIDRSDVFFLFWSTSAKHSQFVEREWRYALEHKGEEFIRPVIIEGPPPVTPPPELERLHFNDKFVYFLQ